MMASLFMVLTISVVTAPGADTPINTSAPINMSAKLPAFLERFVTFAISSFTGFMPLIRPSYIAPLRSQSVKSLTPAESSSLLMAMAAAPAPLITTRISSIFLSTTFKALVRPAKVITAVPCWSSWKTGMSQRSFSFFSISKQRGAAMSSKFTPPKEPASMATVLTISSTSLLRMHKGIASTSPKALNRTHLPSMTGIPASGPISPSPKTAVPSVTTATVFQRRVSS